MRPAWLVLLAACGSTPATPPSNIGGPVGDAATENAMEDYPSYPGARALTDGRVYGSPPARVHISWTTTATADSPATVVAYYEKRLPQRATTDGKTWTFTKKTDDGSTWVSRTIEIIPAALAKDFPGREVPPAAGEQTVIMSSIAMGPHEAP
jgi:hypothetical protein